MKCEELQLNLSVYLDDVLTAEERALLDGHLRQCPACRQNLTEFRLLRRNLQMLPRPAADKLVSTVRSRVARELQAGTTGPADRLRAWARIYLVPYSVGTVASLVFGFLLLWTAGSLQTPDPGSAGKTGILLAESNREDLPARPDRDRYPDLQITGESPTINPQGALIALTKSLARGEIKDDEVVVVADVFGDGLAQIAEVVEPAADRKAVLELEQALKTNPAYAPPFLPADIDHRSDTVRVVLKIKTVNVKTVPTPTSP